MDRFVVGRIISKLHHRKKKISTDSLQTVEISKDGLQQAEEFFRENKKTPLLSIAGNLSDKLEAEPRKDFLQFQGELEASKLIKDAEKPEPPAKILKLPRK